MSNAYSPGWQSQEYHQLSRTQRAAISSFPCCRQPELGSEGTSQEKPAIDCRGGHGMKTTELG